MSYDLNILVLDDTKPGKPENIDRIILRNEIDDKNARRYHTIWPFMTHMKGIWYSLVTENGLYTALDICNPDYETKLSVTDIPYWISNEDEVIYDLRPLHINDFYQDEFNTILSFLLSHSPIKTVMFLVRYQSEEREIVCGVFSKAEFLDLLRKGRILCNICYIIRE